MRQHGGDLTGIGGERKNAAGHVDITARQREGVDLGRVEDGDLELRIRLAGGGEQASHDAGEHDLGLPVLIDAAV
jgi:hypothetical protein